MKTETINIIEAYKHMHESSDYDSYNQHIANLSTIKYNKDRFNDVEQLYSLIDKIAKSKGYSLHASRIHVDDKRQEIHDGIEYALGGISSYDGTEEEYNEYINERTNEAINWVNNLPDKMLIYRAVHSKSIDGVRVDAVNVGPFWTIDTDTAINFGSHNGSNFIICGEVDKKDCELETMAELYGEFSYMDDADSEFEVRVDGEHIRNIHVIPSKNIKNDKSRVYTKYRYYQKGDIIKCGDATTFDNNGNLIPLNQRFNDEIDDIRY